MREILFKAKRKDWKNLPKEKWWVEGYLFDDGMTKPKHYFIGGIIVKPYEGTACDEWDVVGIDFCEIDPDTLCQYTGLTDKNGKKIWENDIVVLVGACGRFVCKWADYIAQFIFENNFSSSDFVCYRGTEIEVIGNIFDNADLLEVE